MLNVGLLLGNFNGGGAERVIITYANELKKRGYDVTLIVANDYGPLRYLVSDAIRLVILNKARIRYCFFDIIKLIKQLKLNYLISTLSNNNIIAILTAKLSFRNVKVIIREATTPSSNILIYRNNIEKYITKLLFRFASAVIAVSEGVKNDLIKFYNISSKKVKVIYNPVTHDILNKGIQNSLHHFFQTDTPVIISLGRISPEKNYTLLINAVKEVTNQGFKVKLLILGQTDNEPSEYKKILDLIKNLKLENEVDLPGYKTNAYEYILKSKVLVLSSLYEGLPNVLLLGLQCSIPIVSTNCCSGVKEILGNNEYGIVIENNTISDLANGIIHQLITPFPNPEIMQRRLDFFSVEKCISSLIELMEEIR